MESILETTADDLGVAGYDTSFAYGRVNAGAAVVEAKGFTPAPDATPPTTSLEKRLPKLSCSWQTVSIRASLLEAVFLWVTAS